MRFGCFILIFVNSLIHGETCEVKYMDYLLFFMHEKTWSSIVTENQQFATELCISFKKLAYMANEEERATEIFTMIAKVTTRSDKLLFCFHLTQLDKLYVFRIPFELLCDF